MPLLGPLPAASGHPFPSLPGPFLARLWGAGGPSQFLAIAGQSEDCRWASLGRPGWSPLLIASPVGKDTQGTEWGGGTGGLSWLMAKSSASTSDLHQALLPRPFHHPHGRFASPGRTGVPVRSESFLPHTDLIQHKSGCYIEMCLFALIFHPRILKSETNTEFCEILLAFVRRPNGCLL